MLARVGRHRLPPPLPMRAAFPKLLILLAPMLWLTTGHAVSGANCGKLSIAAAADLVFCLEKLDAAFQLDNPNADLKVATGSSGNFFAQIQNGAPFGVFLSADV